MKTTKIIRKVFGALLLIMFLLCAMIETPDMTEVWLKLIAVPCFASGLWLLEAFEWQRNKTSKQ